MNQPMPSAPEIEAGLLSILMLAPVNLHTCKQILTEDSFYTQKYKIVWSAIVEANKTGDADMIVVTQTLRDMGKLEEIGGPYELLQISNSYTGFGMDVNRCCAILYEKQFRRAIITEGYKLVSSAYNSPIGISAEISQFNNLISEAMSKSFGKTETAHDVSIAIAQEISDNLGKYQEVTGVPTGFESYDKRIGGLSTEGDLIVIAARPGMGKTTFALNAAKNAQEHFGKSGVFFSLEMSKKQLCRILIAKETGIPTSDLRKNKVTDFQIDCIFQSLMNTDLQNEKAKLFIEDSSSQLTYIVAKIHELKRKHDIQFAVIDYLQLMTCEGKGTRELEISFISRTLKQLSKELGIAIVPLCQLNRSVETRGGTKIPQLSDLRGSGAIEQDASVITFLWRPEYYGIMENENNQSLEGVTVLITAKSRFDGTGKDYLYFDKTTSNFLDYNIDRDYKKSVLDYDTKLVTMQDMNADDLPSVRQKIENESKLPF